MIDRKRFIVAGLALVLTLSACGGGENPVFADPIDANEDVATPADPAAGPDAGFDEVSVADARRASAVALGQFGDLPTAGVAILGAYDRGFSFDQIVDALDAGTLQATGMIDGAEPGQASGGFMLAVYSPVRVMPLLELDVEKLSEALQEAQIGFGTASIEDAPEFFLELILHAAHDGYSVDLIVEAIIFGGFTEATMAEMQARDRELRRNEVRDELEYCRMRSAMAQYTGLSLTFDQCVLDQTGQSVDDLYGPDRGDDPVDEITDEDDDTAPAPTGTGGLGANPAIPGPDGSMTRQSITMAIDGDTVTLNFDIAFTTAVDYVDEAPVCFDDFTFTSGASNLTLDGPRVSGTTDLILNFDGATNCPQSEQDDIGIPQPVDITGEIVGGTFVGQLSIAELGIPFTATVIGG